MATLLETLQQRLAVGGNPPPAPSQQGPNLEEILAAKKGKAPAAPAAPGGGNVQVDIAKGIGNLQVAQQQQVGQQMASELGQQAENVQQKLQVGQEQLAGQQRQAQNALVSGAALQRQDMANTEALANTQRQATENLKSKVIADNATLALANLASDRNISRDNIFSMARMENAELANRRDAASLEQKAFLLAMSDKAYVDELNRIGDQRKLQDQINFDKEVQDLTFGQEMSRLLESFGFQADQNAKDRTMKEQIAQLSNAQIIQLADVAARQENMRSMWTGIGNLASKGTDAYIAYKSKQGNKPDSGTENEG